MKKKLTEEERRILADFRSGKKTAKEICDEYLIYFHELRKLAKRCGYGY